MMRKSSVDWRRLRETIMALVPGLQTASARASTATTVDLPAWRQQLSKRREWVDSRTSTCQGSGSRPRLRMRGTAGAFMGGSFWERDEETSGGGAARRS